MTDGSRSKLHSRAGTSMSVFLPDLYVILTRMPNRINLRVGLAKISTLARRLFSIFSIIHIALVALSLLKGLSAPGPIASDRIPLAPPISQSGDGVFANWSSAEALSGGTYTDGFTVVMASYRRVPLLIPSLQRLGSGSIPSLRRIILIWQDTRARPPSSLMSIVSASVVPIVIHHPHRNSMNNRFIPLPEIETSDVFIYDDDLLLRSSDLEWGYSVFQEIGRGRRIVGFSPRDHEVNLVEGVADYRFVLQPTKTYSMVLSNAAFLEKGWLEWYSGEEWSSFRDVVDEVFNCDDILINFVVSSKLGQGPLLLQPLTHLKTVPPPPPGISFPSSAEQTSSEATEGFAGLSSRPNHLLTRTSCLNRFADMLLERAKRDGKSGGFPLEKMSWSVSRQVEDRARDVEWDEFDSQAREGRQHRFQFGVDRSDDEDATATWRDKMRKWEGRWRHQEIQDSISQDAKEWRLVREG